MCEHVVVALTQRSKHACGQGTQGATSAPATNGEQALSLLPTPLPGTQERGEARPFNGNGKIARDPEAPPEPSTSRPRVDAVAQTAATAAPHHQVRDGRSLCACHFAMDRRQQVPWATWACKSSMSVENSCCAVH